MTSSLRGVSALLAAILSSTSPTSRPSVFAADEVVRAKAMA
jgi:hypothetical protein